MLLKTKLVATGVAATLATGAGISALNFEISQDSKEKFGAHKIAIKQSAKEMDGAQSIITRLGSKIDGLMTNLTTTNSDLAEAKQEAAENDRARKDAKLEVSKANYQIKKANRTIKDLAEESDAQTTTLNNSKVKLEEAMKSAQNYLNDLEASTQNK